MKTQTESFLNQRQTQRVVWTTDEVEFIAEIVADHRLVDPATNLLQLVQTTLENNRDVIRWRPINTLLSVPSLIERINWWFAQKQKDSFSIIEVDHVVEPTTDYSRLTNADLAKEKSKIEQVQAERMDNFFEEMHRVSVQVNVQAGGHSHVMQMETGNTPTPPAPKVKHKIGLVGLSGGQVEHLRRATKVHEHLYKFVISPLGKQRDNIFNETVSHVLYTNRVAHGLIGKRLAHLTIPSMFCNNIHEMIAAVQNICIGKPLV
jgi:hypothetical protein